MKGKTRQRSNSSSTNSDNARLRQKNSRLKKQIQRLNAIISQLTRFEEIGSENNTSIEAKKEKNVHVLQCPKCEDPMREVDLGVFIYIMCSSCSYRERKK